MKRIISVFLTVSLLIVMASCGSASPAPATESSTSATAGEWSRAGYFTNENDYMLSITWMEDIDEPGWYVGCMLGEDPIEDSYGGVLKLQAKSLTGTLNSSGSKDDISVTVTEEGTDGVLLAVDGGETYHFSVMEMQEATIIVHINTEGQGMIAYEEGDKVPEIDPEYPYQSAQINLAEPTAYTFAAAPEDGYVFVKWTKNGEEISAEPVISVQLDESADYAAIFAEDPDWQNPVMNFIGEYQCDRAHAKVECFDKNEAWITIDWPGSATETAHWDIVGKLDLETLKIEYTGCSKQIFVYDEEGNVVSEEQEYGDGTGSIVFGNDSTFTWHEDQSATGSDMVFEWSFDPEQVS